MKRMIALTLAALLCLSLCACGAEPAEKKVDLGALYETMLQDMTEMLPIEGDTRLNFLGIRNEDCSQVYTAFAADGLLTDELWLVEAKDQEAMDRLTKLAESRMTAKAEETVSYSPEQYAVVEKGQILQNGLYLILIVSPNVETLKAAAEAALA